MINSEIEIIVKKIAIPPEGGTYLLFLKIMKPILQKIGSLGIINFPKGHYFYVGSALGPGGLNKRIVRHLRKTKKIFWHIDYLITNPEVHMLAIAYQISREKNECLIVKKIIDFFSDDLQSITNFGSSDCHCKSHLLYCKIENHSEILSTLEYLSNKNHLDLIFKELPIQGNL
ncbi:MAG: DUF123 domain-containing protein [Candidatus Thorarchaeota archaeon]